jgi:hypothetical protein
MTTTFASDSPQSLHPVERANRGWPSGSVLETAATLEQHNQPHRRQEFGNPINCGSDVVDLLGTMELNA